MLIEALCGAMAGAATAAVVSRTICTARINRRERALRGLQALLVSQIEEADAVLESLVGPVREPLLSHIRGHDGASAMDFLDDPSWPVGDYNAPEDMP